MCFLSVSFLKTVSDLNTISKVANIENRAVVKSLARKRMSPQNIKVWLDEVYGENAPSYSVVKEEDDARIGRTVELLTGENIALVEDLVLGNRRLKVKNTHKIQIQPFAESSTSI